MGPCLAFDDLQESETDAELCPVLIHKYHCLSKTSLSSGKKEEKLLLGQIHHHYAGGDVGDCL
jgi:hypothetical protein